MQHPRTAVNSLSWGIRLLGGRASNIVWEFWIPKMQMSSFKPSNISWIYDHLSLYVYIYIYTCYYLLYYLMHWDIFATQTHFAVLGLCNNNLVGTCMNLFQNASYGILYSTFNHTFSTIPKQDPFAVASNHSQGCRVLACSSPTEG